MNRLTKEKLYNYLKEKRCSLGITQKDLADRLRKPQSYVSKYESGERNLDFLDVIEVIEALGEVPEIELVKIMRIK